MAKKYYAVVKGKAGSGIYRDWSATEADVSGVSGVKFKSFADEAGAVAFLLAAGVPATKIRQFSGGSGEAREPGHDKAVPKGDKAEGYKSEPAGHKAEPIENQAEHKAEPIEDQAEGQADSTGDKAGGERLKGAVLEPSGRMTAYVDGSFRQGYAVYGYGVVIVAAGQVVHTISGYGSRPEYVSMRNVAGEVLGAVKAMEYALAQGAKELVLYFDYQGIESWARGTWKRNNQLTQGYYDYVRGIRHRLSLTFAKVKGHSGDVFNEMADQLAKEAVKNSDPA